MKINENIASCCGELRSMYGTVVSCLRMKWKTQYSLITPLENIH